MIRSVAVIGLGAMGAPMARRIHAAGFALTVCDPNIQALEPFAQDGVTIAASPADCTHAELVLLIVATPDQVREVVLGADGILVGLQQTRSPVLAIMSTMPALEVQTLGRLLTRHGVELVDAPVSGGAIRAERGTLTVLTGGDAQTLARLAPVFACLGTHHFHCGELGSAQRMKIINNILGIANAVIAAEAYQLALDQGLKLADVVQVLEVSTGRNFTSADPEGPQATFAAMTRDRPAFDALAAILRKDLGQAAALADTTGMQYPVIHGLKDIVDALGDASYAHWRRVSGLPLP